MGDVTMSVLEGNKEEALNKQAERQNERLVRNKKSAPARGSLHKVRERHRKSAYQMACGLVAFALPREFACIDACAAGFAFGLLV